MAKGSGAAGRQSVASFEDYAGARGASRFAADVATNRLPNTSEGQRKRIAEQQYAVIQSNAAKRTALLKEFNDKVSSGKVRPPTRLEELKSAARGHPDNASTQAARRLLRKRNVKW